MNFRLPRLAAVALAIAFPVASLIGPSPVNAASLTIAESGGSSHQVGDTITITPTQDGEATECHWHFDLEGLDGQGNVFRPPGGDGTGTASHFVVQDVATDGLCPALTFRLPNPNTMVAAEGGARLNVQLNAFGGPEGMTSNDLLINYAPSTATPTATSSAPMLLWSLSDSKPAYGQNVTMTMIPVGIAAADAQVFLGGCLYDGGSATAILPNTTASGSTCTVSSDPNTATPLTSPYQVNWTQNGEMAYFTGVLNGPGPRTAAISEIRVFDPPAGPAELTVDFGSSVTSGEAPLFVSFSNLSEEIDDPEYAWTFGDGATSTDRDPTHVYETPGTYTVTLNAVDGERTGSASREIEVHAAPTPEPTRTPQPVAPTPTTDPSAAPQPVVPAAPTPTPAADTSSVTELPDTAMDAPLAPATLLIFSLVATSIAGLTGRQLLQRRHARLARSVRGYFPDR